MTKSELSFPFTHTSTQEKYAAKMMHFLFPILSHNFLWEQKIH